ncbi:MAG: hypothetical protein ABH862_02700 [Candidatus Omnitrophota bacterium]
MNLRAKATRVTAKLKRIYDLLEEHFGDLKWWPAGSDFEVMVGAVLTQNTSWKNVEKAIDSLKRKRLMDPFKIKRTELVKLSETIRSSGFHRIKAERLKSISEFLIKESSGDAAGLKKKKTHKLREMLLEVNGVGPETADSILLYALGKPVFVVDAYTKRIFGRHGLIKDGASYDDVQCLVHKEFPRKIKKMNQFHALLVETAKNFCKKNDPMCGKCPLGSGKTDKRKSNLSPVT